MLQALSTMSIPTIEESSANPIQTTNSIGASPPAVRCEFPNFTMAANRTFWFASIEKFHQAFGQPAVKVPTEAFVNGDFSELVVPGTTTQIPIFVPISWQSDPSLMPTGCDPGAAPGQQFPGNVIPQSCFSTVSKSLLGFVPKPTSSGEVSNFQPSFVPLNTHTVWGFTLDHNFNSRQAHSLGVLAK